MISTPSKLTLGDVRRAMRAALPGWQAQRLMCPPQRDVVISQEILDRARPSSVLVLLYPKNDTLYLVLTLRAATLNLHKGQISLPGGGCDPDDIDFADTALREANEELGIVREQVEVLGPLTEIYVPPSNFLIHPVVAISEAAPQFLPNAHEVASIIEVPVSDLLDPALRSTQLRPATSLGGQMILVPTFFANGYYVWGATAMILAELAMLLDGGD
ncbi:MAG: CoA pyrophosphatase [Anaerolineae bacterium]|nr:CoA pyrophosphatase [Anaerolineae bacterium]